MNEENNDYIGIKVEMQMGFEAFINANGALTIKQVSSLDDDEDMIVLSSGEAKLLYAVLGDLINHKAFYDGPKKIFPNEEKEGE